MFAVMNWKEAETTITTSLKTIYPESEAAAIANWVVEHLSGLKKTDRILKEKRILTNEEQNKFDNILTRLLKSEPVQYVLQEAWFSGLKFYVDKNVLIPRPETEELVEWVIKDCRFPVSELNILDVGCGSGCIPVSLKRRIRKASVWACDISGEALNVAKNNASDLGADIHFIQADFLDSSTWSQFPLFDVITSNPPYIPERDKATMHKNVVVFEPHTALFVPNNNPLVFYQALAAFGKIHLNPGGSVFMEIHESLGEAVVNLFTTSGYNATLQRDMQEKDRMVKAILQ